VEGPAAGSLTPDQWGRLLAESPLALQLFSTRSAYQPAAEAFGLCRVRGTRLQLALALYQLQEGRAAPSLADLVPRYLPAVPVDPHSGQPFQYRISNGERITWFSRNGEGLRHEDLRAGQPVVRTVGRDGDDYFLVPAWAQ
jgi:hypothetical protein